MQVTLKKYNYKLLRTSTQLWLTEGEHATPVDWKGPIRNSVQISEFNKMVSEFDKINLKKAKVISTETLWK